MKRQGINVEYIFNPIRSRLTVLNSSRWVEAATFDSITTREKIISFIINTIFLANDTGKVSDILDSTVKLISKLEQKAKKISPDEVSLPQVPDDYFGFQDERDLYYEEEPINRIRNYTSELKYYLDELRSIKKNHSKFVKIARKGSVYEWVADSTDLVEVIEGWLARKAIEVNGVVPPYNQVVSDIFQYFNRPLPKHPYQMRADVYKTGRKGSKFSKQIVEALEKKYEGKLLDQEND